MRIHDILEIEPSQNVYFVEESYVSLKNITLTLQYLETIRKGSHEEMHGIVDEQGEIMGLALLNEETDDTPRFWALFTNILSCTPVVNKSSLRFSALTRDLPFTMLHRTTPAEMNKAVMEYYSRALVNRQLCETCLVNKEPYELVYFDSRNVKLKELLKTYQLKGAILEICCGNGMSALPLHEMGYDPLTIDIDRCQICQGLEHHALKADRTIVLDATRLSEFFPEQSFDTVVGFMLGSIYAFNKDMWERIIDESIRMLKPGGMVLLTVNKREEIDILQDALNHTGVKGDVIDNSDDKGIYDQWVYVGYKE